MQVTDSGVVERRSANIFPLKRQFTVEGRIWEPQVNNSLISGAKLIRQLDNDRISNLPIELIHCILARLLVHDAAKISVLSKTWRNIWKMHPLLILDELQELYLVKCTGIEHLACQLTSSNNLRMLNICLSETIDWRWLECTNKLESLGLLLPAADFSINSVNLINFLSNSPRLNTLLLNNFTLEVLGRGPSVLEGLTTKMVSLKKLSLYRLGYNMRQILTCLCLIRNLPNLRDLFIGLIKLFCMLELEAESLNTAESTIERHLESLDWKDVFLDRLEAVKISGVDGSRSTLHLIKIILASSPSLREMSLFCSKTVWHLKEKFRIKQQLWLLPRKSKSAQLLWRSKGCFTGEK